MNYTFAKNDDSSLNNEVIYFYIYEYIAFIVSIKFDS